MSGPWEKYASSGQESGPWTKYTSAEEVRAPSLEGIEGRSVPETGGQPPLEGRAFPKDEAAGYATTRIRNALTGLAATPRSLADFVRYGVDAVGLPPTVANAINYSNPITAVGQHMPTAQQMNDFVSPVLPTVNGIPVVDAGIESAIGGLAMGGGAASVVPSFIGGATSELAGEATKGSKAEPVARVLGGVVGGGATALGQNAVKSVAQGTKNALGPNVDETAAKILARNLERDKMTTESLEARRADLGPGTTTAEAAGPNTRGMMRGALATPGEARTTAQEVFDARRANLPERTNNALDVAITPNRSLAGTVDELNTLRAQQATPAYEAAGIPNRPELIRPERTIQFAMDEPPTTIPAEYNTPQFSSPRLDALIRDSADVRAAIGAARRLPDYKDLPANSMSMLDKAYKHLVGMEQEAVRGGNGTRVHDLQNLRRDFGAAIAEVNPRYGRALEAYSGPSKLIDAAEKGKEWFTKATDSTTVAREFQAMSPAEQDAAKIGIRDWARAIVERSDRGTPSDKVFGGEGVRQRLKAVLSDAEYSALEKEMGAVRNTANTIADIRVGSRTAPMLGEANDNAMQTGLIGLNDLAWGHPVAATLNVLRRGMGRIAEGKTEAVNARLAEIATMTDPAQVGLVNALANKAALEEAARAAGRRNALTYGTAVPSAYAASGERR